jgi:hypothetical protein
MTWREIERELIEFFERDGITVSQNDGDKHVMMAAGWPVSLTKLAQRLGLAWQGKVNP